MDSKKVQLLLVEDDAIIASGLIYAFERANYVVTYATGIKAAIQAINEQHFDIAILDVQLPDGSGFELATLLKATSILYLTVIDDEGNIVRAFENGAEDYVTKPFRLGELLARIKAILRRQEGNGVADILSLGGITINVTARKVYKNGEPLELKALEYRLLLTFATNKDKVLTRTQILDQIWDNAGNFVEDNTLTVYIKRLREKLGDVAQIETVRGIGYRAIDN